MAREITLGKAFGWVVGIVLVLVGIASFSRSIAAALLFILGGIVAIPLVRSKLEGKASVRLSKGVTITIVLVMVGAGFALMPSTKERHAGYELSAKGCAQACIDSIAKAGKDTPQMLIDQCGDYCNQIEYAVGKPGLKTAIDDFTNSTTTE